MNDYDYDSDDSIDVPKPKIYDIAELNNVIKTQIMKSFNTDISVQGEISNYKLSGKNIYMSLRDSESCISIVKFGTAGVPDLKNGDIVVVKGRINCYIKSGTYNIIASFITKAAIQTDNDYKRTYDKYNNMGYFADECKKPIPNIVNNIGIITALNGAALQDILFIFNKHNIGANVIVKNCAVQGNLCPNAVHKSINYLVDWRDNNNKPIDIILITRGGGSSDDLMGFSDEIVINAIHKCPIYTISAIGHEVDFMLSDFAADLRQPTPTAAAEYICSHIRQHYNADHKLLNSQLIDQYMMSRIQSYRTKLANVHVTMPTLADIITNKLNMLDNNMQYDTTYMTNQLATYRAKFNKLDNDVERYNIRAMLDKGYCIVSCDDVICNNVNDLDVGQKLKIIMNNGVIKAKIKQIQYE